MKHNHLICDDFTISHWESNTNTANAAQYAIKIDERMKVLHQLVQEKTQQTGNQQNIGMKMIETAVPLTNPKAYFKPSSQQLPAC